MVLDWLGKGKAAGPATVADLLARKQFAKAVELAQALHKVRPRDARTRLQLSDALVAAGRGPEAVPLLREVADELATEGFAAKSIALLKRIQKIEPGQAKEVDERLATLIEQRSSQTLPPGFLRATSTPGASMPSFGMDEIGFEPTARSPQAPPRENPPEPLVSGAGSDWFAGATAPAEPPAASAPPQARAVEDDLDLDLEAGQEETDGGAPLTTPLFPHFSKDELLLVMRGLELHTFAAGDIVVAEGEAGHSLFIITSGAVKAWLKDAGGHYNKVRQLGDGDFFGEISVLTGKPRTATVTAATACELLELDRETLDGITATHPHVRTVLQQFYDERMGKQAPAATERPIP